jgi:hypothetical protein
MDRISRLRNLGPASEAAFARAGIDTAGQLHDLGADAAYARLLGSGARPHFMMFVALVTGLQNRPFTDVAPREKADLRRRFDAIVAAAAPAPQPPDAPDSDLERALDALGIVPPQRR